MKTTHTFTNDDLREALADLLVKRGFKPDPRTFRIDVTRGYEGNQFDHEDPSATLTMDSQSINPEP